jgi:uncharacterized lipoprotein YmbA
MTARRLIPLALALLLPACAGSPPVRYHSLALPAVPATSGSAERLVEVLPVAMPGRSDRAALVLTGADGRLEVWETDRWAAPPADEVRAVLIDALWRAARAADVYAAPVPAAASALPQFRLAARLERFDAVPGEAATVEASWTLRRLPGGPVAACRAAARAPLPGHAAEDAVAALGAATRDLALRIARGLPDGVCPE